MKTRAASYAAANLKTFHEAACAPRLGRPYTVVEGGAVSLDGTASLDPDSGDILTYAWDLDGNGTCETPGATPTFAGIDGPASDPVALQVCGSLRENHYCRKSLAHCRPKDDIPFQKLTAPDGGEPSSVIRRRVETVRETQARRLAAVGKPNLLANGRGLPTWIIVEGRRLRPGAAHPPARGEEAVGLAMLS